MIGLGSDKNVPFGIVLPSWLDGLLLTDGHQLGLHLHILDKAPRHSISISISIWIFSSDTFCQLNQFHTDSEAAMLSTISAHQAVLSPLILLPALLLLLAPSPPLGDPCLGRNYLFRVFMGNSATLAPSLNGWISCLC